jgi:hypothetical protein
MLAVVVDRLLIMEQAVVQLPTLVAVAKVTPKMAVQEL